MYCKCILTFGTMGGFSVFFFMPSQLKPSNHLCFWISRIPPRPKPNRSDGLSLQNAIFISNYEDTDKNVTFIFYKYTIHYTCSINFSKLILQFQNIFLWQKTKYTYKYILLNFYRLYTCIICGWDSEQFWLSFLESLQHQFLWEWCCMFSLDLHRRMEDWKPKRLCNEYFHLFYIFSRVRWVERKKEKLLKQLVKYTALKAV